MITQSQPSDECERQARKNTVLPAFALGLAVMAFFWAIALAIPAIGHALMPVQMMDIYYMGVSQ